MNRNTKTKTLLLASLGGLLLSVGVYGLVYREVVKAHEKLTATHVEYDTMTREREHRDEVRALVAETDEMRRELAHYLVPEEPIDFLNMLEKELAMEANVTLTVESLSKGGGVAVKPKKDEQPKDPHVRVVLVVEGQWENIYHLLALLEAMPYALSVDRVHVSEKEKEDWRGWGGQIHLSVNTEH